MQGLKYLFDLVKRRDFNSKIYYLLNYFFCSYKLVALVKQRIRSVDLNRLLLQQTKSSQKNKVSPGEY